MIGCATFSQLATIVSQLSRNTNTGEMKAEDKLDFQIEHLNGNSDRFDLVGTVIALVINILMGITHPTMLARYNLRGQEALDDSGAFFFCEYVLASVV
jgi:hypothetical protein